MTSSLKHVLAVDPGKMTGIALLVADPSAPLPRLLWSVEVQQHEYAAPIRDAFSQHYGGSSSFVVVCERFTINAATVRNSAAPFSLEQIGILKQICLDNDYPLEEMSFQSPADAKKMFDNDKLRAVGAWHRGGAGHANDAIRHGLLYLVKSGWKPRADDLSQGSSNSAN